jgi:hypothetical protein
LHCSTVSHLDLKASKRPTDLPWAALLCSGHPPQLPFPPRPSASPPSIRPPHPGFDSSLLLASTIHPVCLSRSPSLHTHPPTPTHITPSTFIHTSTDSSLVPPSPASLDLLCTLPPQSRHLRHSRWDPSLKHSKPHTNSRPLPPPSPHRVTTHSIILNNNTAPSVASLQVSPPSSRQTLPPSNSQ